MYPRRDYESDACQIASSRHFTATSKEAQLVNALVVLSSTAEDGEIERIPPEFVGYTSLVFYWQGWICNHLVRSRRRNRVFWVDSLLQRSDEYEAFATYQRRVFLSQLRPGPGEPDNPIDLSGCNQASDLNLIV
uniref:Uncharacterized protein n=1 Tax=Timema shepardi TaxID=629360 RepID=A0A7R9G0R7_TIMSH|nr:unnamed protein product [Timema shepardi]